jgi:hypothetical protein
MSSMCTRTGANHSASRVEGECAHPALARKDLVGRCCPCYRRQRVPNIVSFTPDIVTDGASVDKWRLVCVSVGSGEKVIAHSKAANDGIVSADQG